MTKKQESKLNMYDAVLAHCVENASIVASIAALDTAVAKLDTTVTKIKQSGEVQATKGSGASNKKNAKKALCDAIFLLTEAVSVYATDIEDSDLKDSVKYTPSDLKRLKDEDLPNTANVVKGIATPIKTNLANYGIANANFTALDTAITNYNNLLTKPGTVKGHKMSATNNLAANFKAADTILKESMDKLVRQLTATQKDFVDDYFNVRIIQDAATTHTTLKGTITDEVTQEPIKDAKFTLAEIGTEVPTDIDGKFTYPTAQPGTYEGKAQAAGYADKAIPEIIIKLGKITNLKITLKPL